MFDIGIPELLIILVVILVLFGPGRISKTMSELGSGLRAFKDGLSPSEENQQSDE